jgi:hypothetical protein
VSAGYQRHFAHAGLIRLWHKHDNTWTKPVGVRDCFVEKGFNSAFTPDTSAVEHLEKEWERIENFAIPAIDALRSGDRSEGVVVALKALTAMHFARSYSHRDLSDIALNAQRDDAADFEGRHLIVETFVSDFGRQPKAGEIEQRVRENIDTIEKSNLHFVDGMVRIHNRVMGILDPLHLQVAVPATRAVGFIIGDTPVVIQAGMRVGTRNGVGIGNCSHVYVPLSRWTAVSFVLQPHQDLMLIPAQVQQLNLLMRRSCITWLAAHPYEDIPRALAMKAPNGWPPERHLDFERLIKLSR